MENEGEREGGREREKGQRGQKPARRMLLNGLEPTSDTEDAHIEQLTALSDCFIQRTPSY